MSERRTVQTLNTNNNLSDREAIEMATNRER